MNVNFYSFLFLLIVIINQNIFAQKYSKCVLPDTSENKILKAIQSRNNYLYTGIDNPLKIAAQLDCKKLKFNIDNGTILKDTNRFFVIPSRAGRAHIHITGIEKNQDTVIDTCQTFIVKYVPEPKITINDKVINNVTSLNKNFLIQADSIGILISKDIKGSGSWFTITSFTFGVTYGNHYISYSNDNNIFSERTKQLIRRAMPGQEVSFRISLKSNNNLSISPPIIRATIK